MSDQNLPIGNNLTPPVSLPPSLPPLNLPPVIQPSSVQAIPTPIPAIAHVNSNATQRKTEKQKSTKETKKSNSLFLWILVILLALGVGYMAYQLFNQNSKVVDLQNQLDNVTNKLNDETKQLNDANNKLQEKETFNATVTSLYKNLHTTFSGVPLNEAINFGQLEQSVSYMNGEAGSFSIEGMQSAIDTANQVATQYTALVTTATQNATTNETGTSFEAEIDTISKGLTEVKWYTETDGNGCPSSSAGQGQTILACVKTDSGPYVIWLNQDAYGIEQAYMGTDELNQYYKLIAVHEFMHTIQLNDLSLSDQYKDQYFDGDVEFFADCMGQAFYGEGWKPAYTNYCSADQQAKAQEFIDASLIFGSNLTTTN